MKLCVLLCAAWPLAAQSPAFHLERFHGRQAYVLENGKMRVSALRGGGHLAEIRLLSPDSRKSINPMRVPHYPTIEPYQYDPSRDDVVYGSDSHRWISSGYMGHMLCFPEFGPPSPDEVRSLLGNHGEAPIVEWKQQKSEATAAGVSLWYSADLPKTQYRVGRRLFLPAGKTVLYVDEWVENLAPYDRPINWVQHATFGPPFAAPGRNFLDISAGRGQVGQGSKSLAPESQLAWPRGKSAAGQDVSLRGFQAAEHAGTYYALLMDRTRPDGWFTCYNADYSVLIGYLFPVADNPWIGDWQENRSITGKPWNGEVVARGIEFGSSPMPEGRRKSVERGSMFGVPTYRWIGARQKLETHFAVFLAEIPAGFEGVSDVRVAPGRIEVATASRTRPAIVIPAK